MRAPRPIVSNPSTTRTAGPKRSRNRHAIVGRGERSSSAHVAARAKAALGRAATPYASIARPNAHAPSARDRRGNHAAHAASARIEASLAASGRSCHCAARDEYLPAATSRRRSRSSSVSAPSAAQSCGCARTESTRSLGETDRARPRRSRQRRHPRAEARARALRSRSSATAAGRRRRARRRARRESDAPREAFRRTPATERDLRRRRCRRGARSSAGSRDGGSQESGERNELVRHDDAATRARPGLAAVNDSAACGRRSPRARAADRAPRPP